MAIDITIAAERRDSRGKNEARRLRMKGMIPAVLYGGKQEPVALSVSPKEVTRILHSKSGHNTIFRVGVAGEHTPAMLVDWTYEPIKDTLLHVDLKRIDLTKRITVSVPVLTTGDPKGVKIQGGLLEIITREIDIECLPEEIPENFVVDVAELLIGQSVRAADIALTPSMKLMSPPDSVMAHVIALRAEEVAPAAEAAATPATTGSEPEVIKKGKKEEEAAAEGEKKKK